MPLFSPVQALTRNDLVSLAQRTRQEVLQLRPELAGRVGAKFDLDDTLFSTGFRTVAAFVEFITAQTEVIGLSHVVELERQARELADRFQVPYKAMDLWDRLMGSSHPGLQGDWLMAWRSAFFTERLLPHERLYPGTLKLVRSLGEHMPVGYVTGRHQACAGEEFPQGMKQGTLDALESWDFPFGETAFKPLFRMADSDFKAAHFRSCVLDPLALVPAVYLDNEPGLAAIHHLVMEEAGLPHVSVWISTVCLDPSVLIHPKVRVLQLFP